MIFNFNISFQKLGLLGLLKEIKLNNHVILFTLTSIRSSGVGEQDIIQASYTTRSNNKDAKVIEADDTAPYLLLDIRDRDEYDQCHIITALNYPIAMLSRSINNETKELLAYKNQEGNSNVLLNSIFF